MTLPLLLLMSLMIPTLYICRGVGGQWQLTTLGCTFFLKLRLETSARYHHWWFWATMWTVQVNFCNMQSTQNVLKFSGSELLRPLTFLEVPGKGRALAGLGRTWASWGARSSANGYFCCDFYCNWKAVIATHFAKVFGSHITCLMFIDWFQDNIGYSLLQVLFLAYKVSN